MVSQGPPTVLEQSNDVIIQNLVVPSNLLTTQQNPNDPINLHLQNTEGELPSVSASKTSSGLILETRPNNDVVNNVANSITACQIPTKPSHGTQVFEETNAAIEQINGKVKTLCAIHQDISKASNHKSIFNLQYQK